METVFERPLYGNQFTCYSKFGPRDGFDSTYRKIHQAANLISYDTNPHSVTREDYALKCLESKDNARTSYNKCMPSLRKSQNLSQNEGQYENINHSLLQKPAGTSSTFNRVMQAADILPANQYQKSATVKDYHPKPFDTNDYILRQSMDGRAISCPNNSTLDILSTSHEMGPFDKKTPNKHTDYEKDVRDTKCTFLRVMQAVDWKNPDLTLESIYERDYVPKLSNSPSKFMYKSQISPSNQNDARSSHICNNVSKSEKYFEGNISPRIYYSNYSKDNITENFRKKREELPDRICKKETHLSKFQYSEPLLFPSDHFEMTAPLVNAKDLNKRWIQIMENTQAKHNKCSLKQEGKCLPCYKKAMSSPEKSSKHRHAFVPTTTEQVLDKCKQPKYTAKLDNINPNYFRRDDFADSSNQRVFQASDRVVSDVPPMSETAESLQKTVELLPDAKASELKANVAAPSKAKSYAEFISPNVGEFPFTKESCFRSSDLRNIISGDAYMGYDRNLKSVTKSDYNPKVPSCEKGIDVLKRSIPRSSPRVQFRKTRSQLADLQCPRREGMIKFMDDEDLSLLRNNRR